MTEPGAAHQRTRDPWYAAYVVASRVNEVTDALQGWLFRQHIKFEKRRRGVVR